MPEIPLATAPEVPRTYEPASIEAKWYAFWESEGCFAADPARVSEKRPAYSIVIPPPNVTGVLTLGHVLNNTIQDILARRARMLGKEVLWLPGTDHAGIATQNVVERTLRKSGEMKHRDDLGREALVGKIWEWKEKYGGIILQQLRALGCSCDWSRARFTMDAEYSRCVQSVFVDLYKKGLIYRGKRMVNWDPVALTALSDEEVVMKEQNGTLYYFRVEVVEEPGRILTIATTRPETIPGDTAIAVNPDDARYADLIGKSVRRPLPRENQAPIPIVGDHAVAFNFGTGVLKVTPAHDKTDYEIGQRHQLPIVEVLDARGVMNDLAGRDLAGLDRFAARITAAELLTELGALEKAEPYKNNVGHSERADVPIEPRLSEQWFLKYPSVEQSKRCVVPAGFEAAKRKNVAVVVLSGDEIKGSDRGALRESALKFARSRGWIGQKFSNRDTGWQILLRRKSLSHAFSARNEAAIKAVAAMPGLIESAVLLFSEPHEPKSPDFKAVHHLVAALTLGGELHRIPITVKEGHDGQFVYDYKAKKSALGGKPPGPHPLAEKLDFRPAPSAQIRVSDLIADVNYFPCHTRFHPDRWAKVYEHWMGGLQDWCISRQLWWGHRVPVWYRNDRTTISESGSAIHVDIKAPSDPENWTQDPDVLDTWFSSWLWPFATMGWPEKTNTLAKFYPTTDLVTGPDIIFFWVARMIMAGFEWMGELPFRNVYFTGIIRDKQGRKMSKSLGNSPDPLDLIAQYGADALRFGVMRSAPLGADILFDEKNAELGRNFCTKLWNATRFRQMQAGETEGEITPALLTSDDKWILLKLSHAIEEASRALDEYRFSDAAQTLYRFFWSEFCDWYLEATKAVLNSGDDARRANTLAVLDFVLGHTLRLAHPFLPFITEELWQGLGYHADLPPDQGGRTIMFAHWPKAFTAEEREYFGLDESDEQFAAAKQAAVEQGRALRRDYNIASNKRVRFALAPSADLAPYEIAVLQLLLNAEPLEIAAAGWTPPRGTPVAITPLGELFLPLEGLIDADAERTRLDKELAKTADELAKVRAKLANPNFSGKVPPAVLEEHRQRETTWADKLAQLEKMRAALSGS